MQIKIKLLRFLRLYIYFFTIVLFIIFFSTAILKANSFKVSNLEISEPFELNFDKNKVIDRGFKLAFINLISMITTSGDKKKIQNTSLKVIKGMVDSFTISKEKFIDETYYANIDVVFNKKNTLFFLEKKNIFPSIPFKNKVLLIPIIIDLEKDNLFLFSENDFYNKWNIENENFHLLEYLLPSEDLDDLNSIQRNFESIENYDFLELIKKYDLKDYIITIVFKKKNQVRVLSKINFNNSLKLDNQNFINLDLNKIENFNLIMAELKEIYEDNWKKNNQINTSIKLPLTISVNSNEYTKIQKLENSLKEMDLVSQFDIIKFDNQNSIYRVIYNGSPKNFLNDMKKKKLVFSLKEKIWKLK